ncbi:predicted protein [Naegleria gruberi]|uniref:Predicted protein n=1 Tax=Naegleria gruberi TaxID=5762 RepID=D2VC26_NAEGR|nr:uncharacterized protein NAEGRDRAFT_48326 [Naegleria gruberi]EFC45673.1 predicted protein [Naegleria gruberi]|eukprot:XP_002678417.1 predicted protein [Naegleria gruberi strain NEG-M]
MACPKQTTTKKMSENNPQEMIEQVTLNHHDDEEKPTTASEDSCMDEVTHSCDDGEGDQPEKQVKVAESLESNLESVEVVNHDTTFPQHDESGEQHNEEPIVEEEVDQELQAINELKRKINQAHELVAEHANQMERALKKRRERDALLTSPIPLPQEVIKYFERYKSQTLAAWLEDNTDLDLDTLVDLHIDIFGAIERKFSAMMNEASKSNVFNYVKSISSTAETRVNEILYMYIPKMIENFQMNDEPQMETYLAEKKLKFWCNSNLERVEFFKHFLSMKLVAKPMHFDFQLPQELEVSKIDQKIHLQNHLDLQSGKIDKVILPRLVFDEDGSTALEGLYLVK